MREQFVISYETMESRLGRPLALLDYHTLLLHSSYSSLPRLRSRQSAQANCHWLNQGQGSRVGIEADVGRRGAGRHAFEREGVESGKNETPGGSSSAGLEERTEDVLKEFQAEGSFGSGDMGGACSDASENVGVRPRGEVRVSAKNDADFRDASSSMSSNLEARGASERDLLAAEVMTSLGPGGTGLLAVRGVPAVDQLRRRLLPLAKTLALMPDVIRRRVLKDHGLSTDVPLKKPDRPVSAFAAQLQFCRHSHAEDWSCDIPCLTKSSPGWLCNVLNGKELSKDHLARGQSDLEQLGSIFRQLGACMVEVGLLVAQICDSAISGAGLEDSIWESGSVKARLIHYHAYSEKNLLSYPAKMGNKFKRKGTSGKNLPVAGPLEDRTEPILQSFEAVNITSNSCTAPDKSTRNSDELWQQWHYDYGLLTVLTAPMFLSLTSSGSTFSTTGRENRPGGHTGLRILSDGMDDFVSVPPDCLIVQVGEAAQIASGGKLAATAHCVSRPASGQFDINRETFVTFLQPAWHRVLSPPRGVTRAEVLNPKPDHKSVISCVQWKKFQEEQLRLRRAELNPKAPGKKDGEDFEGVTVAEVLHLKPLNRSSDVLSQSKEGKEDVGVTDSEVLNPLLQCKCGLDNCEEASCAAEKSSLPLQGSARADQFSECAKVLSMVPSLDSRWKEGCTFADFAKVTTGQYYGAHGCQSQKKIIYAKDGKRAATL